MFRQSLIQVFKGLAEFHGYVPVIPLAHTEPDNTTAAACQVKQVVTLPSEQAATVSCC